MAKYNELNKITAIKIGANTIYAVVDADLRDATANPFIPLKYYKAGDIIWYKNDLYQVLSDTSEVNTFDELSTKKITVASSLKELNELIASETSARIDGDADTLQAAKDYVDDEITIKGIKVNSLALTPDADKNVHIEVPTKNSELENDSKYINQDQLKAVSDALDSEVTARSDAMNAEIQARIDGDNSTLASAKAYTDTNGGKIDIIKVNGVEQSIDSDKAVNILVPTNLTDLDNDSTNPFIRQNALNTEIQDRTKADEDTLKSAKDYTDSAIVPINTAISNINSKLDTVEENAQENVIESIKVKVGDTTTELPVNDKSVELAITDLDPNYVHTDNNFTNDLKNRIPSQDKLDILNQTTNAYNDADKAKVDNSIQEGDPRLTDSRTPTAHKHTMADINDWVSTWASIEESLDAKYLTDADLTAIKDVIPSDANVNNKLADKNYVSERMAQVSSGTAMLSYDMMFALFAQYIYDKLIVDLTADGVDLSDATIINQIKRSICIGISSIDSEDSGVIITLEEALANANLDIDHILSLINYNYIDNKIKEVKGSFVCKIGSAWNYINDGDIDIAEMFTKHGITDLEPLSPIFKLKSANVGDNIYIVSQGIPDLWLAIKASGGLGFVSLDSSVDLSNIESSVSSINTEINSVKSALDLKADKKDVSEVNTSLLNKIEESAIYTNSSPTTIEVGGIKKGTTFNNMKLTDIIENLLYPYVKFTFSSITLSSGTTFEYGTTVNVSYVRLNYEKGSKELTNVSIVDEGGNSLYNGDVSSQINITKQYDGTTGGTISATLTDGVNEITKSSSISYKYYNYYTLSSDETAPTTATKTTNDSAEAVYSYEAGQYLYLYDRDSNKKIQTNVLGQWADVTTTSLGPVELTLASGITAQYYVYRTDKFTASGSARYRLY